MSGMTAAEKIFAAHAGRERVEAGEVIFASVDRMLLNDVSGPYAITQFNAMNAPVADPERVVLVNDHFAPPKDVASAEGLMALQQFAKDHGIRHLYEMGDGGIEHTLLPELGLVRPGDLIVGGDSHTSTYGAYGALGTGMGSTDMAAAIALGQLWFSVPETMRFEFTGKRGRYITGKDFILTVLQDIDVGGATYRTMEFVGDAVAELSIDERMQLCNMAAETGSKNCIVPADEVTLRWVEQAAGIKPKAVVSDENATFHSKRSYDVSKLRPLVSKPNSPGNVGPVEDVIGTKVDQVYIGNCGNGTLDDLREAAQILRGRHVARGVRCIIVPATQKIYKRALQEGLIEVFIDAGVQVGPSTCGACAGLHMGVLAGGQVAIANINRNYRGRMGHRDSKVYLANTYVAAASAVAGEIVAPEMVAT